MKMPTYCPTCCGPLLSECHQIKTDILTKKCTINALSFRAYDSDQDYVWKATLILLEGGKIIWDFESKEIFVCKNHRLSQDTILIPWFEPDFSDLKKLKEKVKTYVIFS